MTPGTSVQISTLIFLTDFGFITPLAGFMLSRTTPSYNTLNTPKKTQSNQQNATQYKAVDLHASITHLKLHNTMQMFTSSVSSYENRKHRVNLFTSYF